MAVITIVGSGMMGSALAFPARENGHEVRLVGTHFDREIISACLKENRHPKFEKDFPDGVKFHEKRYRFFARNIARAFAGETPENLRGAT